MAENVTAISAARNRFTAGSQRKCRVAGYARVSTDMEDQQTSYAAQCDYYTRYIQSRDDWEFVGLYSDEGISGTQTKKRDGFNRMIEDAMSDRIDLILTKEVCRFARNTVDTLLYTRKLKEKGVGVIFTIDNIDTRDSDGELRLTLMAGMAQEESRRTSERVKWGQKRRMEQGVVFGRDLLGYTVRGGVLAVNEEEAQIVRAIFHKYADEGKGAHVIARELAEEGMRPKSGGMWSDTAVLRVLHNSKYVGDLNQRKTYTPDYLTHARKRNRGEEEMVCLRDHHEPLVSRQLWERTQAELARRSRAGGRQERYSSRYWCSGKLSCGICGKHFVCRTKSLRDGAVYRAWRCYAAACHGTAKTLEGGEQTGCASASVNERALEACMNHCIRSLEPDRKALKEALIEEIREVKRLMAGETGAGSLRRKAEAVREKKRRAVDLMLEGVISREELEEQTKWYDSQLHRLSGRLAELGEEGREFSEKDGGMARYEDALEEIMAFDKTSREVFGEILDRMVVCSGSRVEVWLKGIPCGIGLVFSTHGRSAGFGTDILDMERIGKV